MARRITPILMCGGSGERLWPLSRAANPKQFLALAGERTLFQETLARLSGEGDAVAFDAPVVIGGESHGARIDEQLDGQGTSPRAVLLEPEGRDTAAAIAAACAFLEREGDAEAIVAVSPCDHVVRDAAAFRASLAEAAEAAASGALVVFGIAPDRPATGYGYIEAGAADGAPGLPVKSFREKPDRETAEGFLAAGDYAWNAGVFMFTARAALHALERHAPEIVEAARAAVADGREGAGGFVLAQAAFSRAPRQPFDIAVMEKIEGARVVRADWAWSDVGSWAAVHEISERNAADNAVAGDVVLEDCAGVLARGEGVTVTALGVSDLVIVATPDAVFVAPRERSEELKTIVSRLNADGRDDLL